MEFFEVLSRRDSVREFSDCELSDPDLNKILKAATAAPSAGNLQAYEIVIARDQQQKIALARAAYGQDFITAAPAVLVFCADSGRSAAKYGRRGSALFCIQDAAIAASYAPGCRHGVGFSHGLGWRLR